MDRSWISTSKPGDPEYIAGVKDFIDFAVKNSRGRTRLPCPCYKCHNFLHKRVDEILNHLSKSAFDRTYTIWIWHGEDREENVRTNTPEVHTSNEGDRIEDMLRDVQEKFDENPAAFESLLTDSEKPLYTGCKKYTRLSSVLKLYNLKATHGLSDTGFTELLEVVKDMLPSDNVLPSKTYEPGNDIDVYLAPLINDLKILWETGVEVYDAYRNESFNLRAMLFCTIQDYPVYGNLSGYTVKGKAPCPICEDGTMGKWLKSSKKNIYDGHRCFLPDDHYYRKLKKAFNGDQEFKRRPRVITGIEVFEKVKDIQIIFGKNRGSTLPKQGYKKCSVFWRLPYWKHLFVRHSLDVMHIEKNVCDSLIGTLLNVPGKTKDGVNARDDLKALGIRKELHIVDKNNKKFLPPAAYTMSEKRKRIL
ncbi:uncharacterized protein LOC141634768 [Silene latifolia]|uniref:uncharacterized protein LOC141634768 n=1 Tax=Silene latifolia TaxID=37657 RepID=UPI003D76B9DC